MHTRVPAAIQLQLPSGELIAFGPETTAAKASSWPAG
jgi:hypothetical protein